ncbi:hypothetical protein CIB84_017050, partial [Bambusicola thoracicus]
MCTATCVCDTHLPPLPPTQGWLGALALLSAVVLCCCLRRPAHHHPHVRCYSTGELRDGEAPAHLLGRSLRWEQHVPVQLVPQIEAAQRRRRRREHSCPALQLHAGLRSEPHERSISPWRYR